MPERVQLPGCIGHFSVVVSPIQRLPTLEITRNKAMSQRQSSQKRNRVARRNKTNRMGANPKGFQVTPTLFPSMLRGKMVYTTTGTMAPAAGVLTSTTFRANSVYDPYFPVGGTTAAGYFFASQIYNKYRVLGCTATITFANVSSTTLEAFVSASPLNNVSLNFDTAMSQRYSWRKALAATGGQSNAEHTVAVPIAKVYGVSESIVRNEDDFSAGIGGNPNNVVYLHLGFYNFSGVAASALYTIRIVYDVIWSLPAALTQ